MAVPNPKASVFLMLIVEVGGLVEFTPSPVRRFDAIPGFSAHNVVQTILLFVVAGQTVPFADEVAE